MTFFHIQQLFQCSNCLKTFMATPLNSSCPHCYYLSQQVVE